MEQRLVMCSYRGPPNLVLSPLTNTNVFDACALLSDNGYLLIQAFFQVLQSYSWGFALIQSLSKCFWIVSSKAEQGAEEKCFPLSNALPKLADDD